MSEPPPRSWPALERAVLVLWAIPSLLMAGGLLYRQTFLIQRLYNEGWNAYFATTPPLYPPPGGVLFNNYPPLSFIAVRALAPILPDAVFAGRLLAGLAFVAIAAEVAAILWSATRDRAATAAGALTFIAYMAVNNADYVGLDDPQMLALAIALPALPLALRGRPAWAALACVLALFVKHNTVALPAALALFLLAHDRIAARRFIGAFLILLAAGLTLCLAACGHDFAAGLTTPRRWRFDLAGRNVLEWVTPMKPLILLGLLPALLPPRDRAARLVAIYLAVSLVVGIVEAGGEGINTNCLFETVAAFALGAGLLLARLRGLFRPALLAALAICAALGPELYDAKDVLTLPGWLAVQKSRAAETAEAVAFLAGHPGPALCAGNPVLCYWAGKPPELDPFNYRQTLQAGRETTAPLRARIEARDFATIELANPDLFLTPDLHQAIAANYVAALPLRHGVIYVRR